MTTREKGTGLGLAIVTKIIEEHGGRIELLDSPEVRRGGHGALIRIALPRFAPATEADRSRHACREVGRRQLMATMASDILIVDDEADIRDIVSGILSDEGHGTRTAADADSALAEIAKRRPSLVFLDIWLQGSRMDGLVLLDTIKRDHPELPIVMISGHGNIETAVSAIKRGAYDYIEKPFKSDRLVLVAERALEASKLRREVQDAARAVGRGCRSDRRLAGDEPPAPADRKGGADQQPGDDLGAVGIRQGVGGARHPSPLQPRRRPVRGPQRGGDHAGAHGRGAVRHRAQ